MCLEGSRAISEKGLKLPQGRRLQLLQPFNLDVGTLPRWQAVICLFFVLSRFCLVQLGLITLLVVSFNLQIVTMYFDIKVLLSGLYSPYLVMSFAGCTSPILSSFCSSI